MSLEALKSQIPDYAKDVKLNLSNLINDETLSGQQKWGAFLACALASRQGDVIAAAQADAAQNLSPEALKAAQSAAAIMAQNNIYYRFVHLASNKDYATLPAKLRMNVIGAPGIEKADFELFSLAVSVINGCGMCIDAHEAALKKEGLGVEHIQLAVRIAAVVAAVAAVLDGEAAIQSVDVSQAA